MRVEKLHCPPHFQARLTRAGGLNRYGKPNFLIVWGQTWIVRRGGTWNDGEHFFQGYRDEIEDKRPCWVLKQWYAPELYGSPALWFIQNRDEAPELPKDKRMIEVLAKSNSYVAGEMREMLEEGINQSRNRASHLQLLGDFPWRGQYETLQPFVWSGLVNGRMVVEAMPLNAMMVDMVIPIAIQCKSVALWRQKLAFQEMEARKDKATTQKVEDARYGAQMAFTGPVSFGRQGCRTSLVDKKMDAISKNWKQAMAQFRKMGLGISIH